MPRKGWTSVTLSDELIEEIDEELKKDKVFKSRASLITHVMIMYLRYENISEIGDSG